MKMIVIGGILIVPAGLELPLSSGNSSFVPSLSGMSFRRTRVLWSGPPIIGSFARVWEGRAFGPPFGLN